MKKISVILLLSVLFASCSDVIDDRLALYRAKETWFSTVTYNRVVDDEIKLIKIDSAYRVGDTMTMDYKHYIILEKVK
jgi:hypothetical protein